MNLDRGGLKQEVLHCLKSENTPEAVKERGYINCTSVIYDYDYSVSWLFFDKIGRGLTFYAGGLADGAIGVMNALLKRHLDCFGNPIVYPFFVRKVEKGKGFVERCFGEQPTPDADHPVIIVDDVLTTGFSVAKAAAAINREWGYKPTLAVVLVDNEMGGKEFLLKKHGIECRSIFTRKEILG